MTDENEDLRKWRLPRGRHGLPRELVERSQRERLLAAVVRVTARKGYEATSVADVLEEAGVGRESFYELFDDKLSCLLAAHAMLVDHLQQTLKEVYEQPGEWPDRIRLCVAAALEWFASDPAAARVTLVELAAVGPVARERFRENFRRFATLLEEGFEEDELGGEARPQAAKLAISAGIAQIYEEVLRERTAELPSLLPELTYEILVPFVGEEIADAQRQLAADSVSS